MLKKILTKPLRVVGFMQLNEEDLSKIHINEEYVRRFEHNKQWELL
jgi:hypothetical protein